MNDDFYLLQQEVILNDIEEDEQAQKQAQKEKELKNSMTWEERMYYWSLLYPLIYRKKAIEKQFGGKDKNILFMICFVKSDKQIKPIYDSILAKDGGILAKWETLNDEIFKIREYQLGKEFKRDVYFPMELEINEAVERDLLKVNIPLLYSFTPLDEEMVDKVYEDSIPF